MPEEKNDSISTKLYRRTAHGDEQSFGLHKLSDNEQPFRKPTLLCLGGIYLQETPIDPEAPRKLNGTLKLVQSIMGMPDKLTGNEPYDVLVTAYPISETVMSDQINRRNSAQAKGEPPPIYKHVEEFTRKYLYPLVEETSDVKCSLDHAKRNLRNINIVAHSYGGSFARQTGELLYSHMTKLGFTPSEAKEALSQVVLVAAGSVAIPGAGNAHFTTFDVISENDVTAHQPYTGSSYPQHGLKDMVQDLFKQTGDDKLPPVRHHAPSERIILPIQFEPNSAQHGKAKLVQAKDSNQFLVYITSAQFNNGITAPVKRPAIDTMLRANTNGSFSNATSKSLHTDSTNHQKQSYFYNGLGRNGLFIPTLISTVLTNGLSNSVENNVQIDAPLIPLQPYKKLLLPCRNVAYSTNTPRSQHIAAATGYAENIEKALAGPDARQDYYNGLL